MAKLVNHAVLTELRTLYPTLELKPLTGQQERLIMLLQGGANLTAAARGAGYSRNETARAFLDSEPAQAIQKYFSDRELERITITKDQLNRMYLELYSERGNPMDGARCVEGLARLNGLNEESRQKKPDTNITIHQQNNTVNNLSTMDEAAARKRLETMDEAKLIEHAGPRFEGFTLAPEEDAVVVDVDQDQDQDHEKEIHGNVENDS